MTTDRHFEILLVEDNPGDARLAEEALKDSGVSHNLTLAEDGEQAMAMVRREGEHASSPRPDLILLDLSLPKKDGREVLEEIKGDADLKRIPVVVLTLSEAEQDILRSYNLQANNYLTKPLKVDDFNVVIKAVENYLRAISRISRN